jgi:hypothetical protein
MAWKKAYPNAVVTKAVKAFKDAHKVKISKDELEDAIQQSSSMKDLVKQLDKKFKKAKAAELESTLKTCGF